MARKFLVERFFHAQKRYCRQFVGQKTKFDRIRRFARQTIDPLDGCFPPLRSLFSSLSGKLFEALKLSFLLFILQKSFKSLFNLRSC